MATWVAHFRIAEALLNHGFDFERSMFVVGNIAPDSGMLNAERTGYVPSADVTHWKNEDRQMQPDVFREKYLTHHTNDARRHAFLMGYYCHLVADKMWIDSVYRPKKATPLYAEPLAEDPQFIWEIKKDWFGLDFLYLHEHPDNIFYTDFVHVDAVPDYLDYFPKDAITSKVQQIQKFYLNEPEWDLDRPYIYLTREEWDAYIEGVIEILKKGLASMCQT